jgi:ATP-binding cassette, subfamily B, bacterial CvaB/MchF/RaxB
MFQVPDGVSLHAASGAGRAPRDDSGLKALALVAQHLQIEVSVNKLRELQGAHAADNEIGALLQLATRIGLTGRIVTLTRAHLREAQGPFILIERDNLLQFAVRHSSTTLSVRRRERDIVQPVGRKERLVVLVFDANEARPKQAKTAPAHLRDIWPRIVGLPSVVAQILFVSSALLVVTFAFPFFSQLVIDEAILKGDEALLVALAIGFGMLALLRFGLDMVRSWALTFVGQFVTYQTVARLVARLIRMPQYFLSQQSVGDLLSRIGSARALQDVVTRTMVESLLDGVMALVAITLLFWYSTTLSLIVLAGFLTDITIGLAFMPWIQRLTQADLVNRGVEQSHLIETLRATTTIKLLGGEALREAAWRSLYLKVIHGGLSLGKVTGTLVAVQRCTGSLQMIVLSYAGASMIIAGDAFSVGMLVAFLSFRATFSERALALINQALQLRFLSVHLDRLGLLVHTPIEHAEPQAPVLDPPAGAITLRRVDFGYEGCPLVLRNVDLDIREGDFVAISGKSGGGKTSLLKLITGLYAPTAGQILLDAQPATSSVWAVWRSFTGIVLQEDELLSGSIAENIAFFDPQMSMDRVANAAKLARIHGDIAAMPCGYATNIGDMGTALSSGQRQRLLIARALYRNPRVLILDEGTANLDEETEREIAAVIAAMPITRIVVAHRPILLEAATRHFVVADGLVSEGGRTG